MFNFLPSSVLQMSTIFLSIIIEALPFVLLGCLISGALQTFLTPERVKKILPKNKFLSIIVGSLLGFFFPSCECGIVPIVNQFMRKGVPTYTAFAFMMTAPIINPIVIFSTFIAFSNSFRFALLRILGSLFVSLLISSWIAYLHKGPVLKESWHEHSSDAEPSVSKKEKMLSFFAHSIDEFFDTGRYLIFGSILAAAMQTYLPTSFMLQLGSTKLISILIMLVLAFTLSLCSEADAFIGSSLLSLFGTAPVVAFLVFGPMVDIKNLMMMRQYFQGKFIFKFVVFVAIAVTIFAYLV